MIGGKKYEKGALGWLREQQKMKAKKGGFDNVGDWLEWKSDPFNMLESKYGKEFANWARRNKDKVIYAWLNAGCKTEKEYKDKCAQNAGFKDNTEKHKEWRHDTGRDIPKELNEECASHTGVCVGEDKIGRPILDMMFEEVDKKKYNNPGFEYVCKNPKQEFLNRYPQFKLERDREYKIDIKTARFLNRRCWIYYIGYNDIADYFLSIALEETRDVPLYTLFIHKNEIIRGRKFWRRVSINICKNHLPELEKYELTYELGKLKELCNIDMDKKDKKKDK